MSSFPVIERELRVQARRPATYYSRLGWGLAATALLVLIVWTEPRDGADGKYVLQIVHGSLAAMLLLLAPLITADSISRERREGTLGLLLLTPLTARQVAFGKLTVHLFRLFYAGLMMVPFMVLPVLRGGVGPEHFILSFAVLVSILVVGACAGMIASALCVQFSMALVLSLIFALIANVVISSLAVNVIWLTRV